MKIAVWGINYSPELTGIAPYNTALCEFLAHRGHTVEMITAFPYYPAWRKDPADRCRLARTDRLAGVTVRRGWHFVPARPTPARRIVHEASFVATSFLRAMLLPRPDAYVVVSPPLLLGLAAWLVSAWKRAPFIFHVQDLQPDAAVALGMLRSPPLIRWLQALERLAYTRADAVSAISPGMIEAIRQKGIPAHRLIWFPNGVRVAGARPGAGTTRSFRTAHRFDPHDFLLVYSGNLGAKQGLGALLDALEQSRNPAVRLVICGDGNQRAALEQSAAARGLDRITFLPLQPPGQYEQMLAECDVGIITQDPQAANCFFPSKLLPMLAAGKPLLVIANDTSELVTLLRQHAFGFTVEPRDPERIAALIDRLPGEGERLRAQALAGRAFARQFEMENVLTAYEERLQELAGDR